MGRKMLVALMMEGKFSGEGLQSLDADEDLMSAMARELVEKAGVGESADAIWRELDRGREKVQPRPVVAEIEEEPAPVLDLPTVTSSESLPVWPASILWIRHRERKRGRRLSDQQRPKRTRSSNFSDEERVLSRDRSLMILLTGEKQW